LDQVEVNAKVKELEDEVKVLKAEIRNVLLDIREAILDNTNPLSEQEPAYLRMDLNTTARAMAAEEATRAARDAIDQARREEPTEDKPEEPEPAVSAELPPEEEEAPEEATSEEPTEEELEEPEPASADLPPEEEETPEEATSEEPTEDEPSGDGDLSSNGKASRKALPDAPIGAAGLPPMQLAYLLPTGAIGGLAAWVTEAMDAIGPQDLERVITIHRLWGSLPPNISYALAHLQRLIRSSKQKDPPWLKIMQDMEKLASS
jgi:outer membrane biosynthesis protein TonB